MRGVGAVPSAVLLLAYLLTHAAFAAPADATPCGGDFASWLQGVKQEAAGKGISQGTIQAALAGVSYEQFSGRMVPPRMARGRRMMQQYASPLSRIEQQYGVPGAVLVAIWGLETDFGADSG